MLKGKGNKLRRNTHAGFSSLAKKKEISEIYVTFCCRFESLGFMSGSVWAVVWEREQLCGSVSSYVGA